MTDMIELNEPAEDGHLVRDEIRRISKSVHARRVTTSRVMMVLCGVALLIAAVPLVMLIAELVKNGLPVLNKAFFTTEPQTPTPVSYTHLRAHETGRNLVCRLLL